MGRGVFRRALTRVDVFLQEVDLYGLFVAHLLHQITDGDHADEAFPVDYREVTATVSGHLRHRVAAAVLWGGVEEVAGHDLGDGGFRDVAAFEYDPSHQVALREDADEACAFEHDDGAGVGFVHAADGVEDRPRHLHRDDVAKPLGRKNLGDRTHER